MSKKKIGIIGGIVGGFILIIVAVVVGMNFFGRNIISEDEAKHIAFQHAKVSENEVERVFVYLDRDGLDTSYDVTFYVAAIEYKYEIHARTGNIKDFDVEGMENRTQRNQESVQRNTEVTSAQNATTDSVQDTATAPVQDTTTAPVQDTTETARANTTNQQAANTVAVKLTEDEARNIILGRIDGAVASDVWIKLDREDGRMVYEGKVVHQGMEYEFELDADNGNVLSWEVESVHD